MELKDEVINCRSEKLLTQEQFALQCGVSLSTIIRIEKGENVSTLTRAKIEKFLKSN